MNAYISSDLNMVRALDPDRHALALQMESFLNKGGTVQVIPVGQTLFSPIPFNSETILPSSGSRPKRNPSAVKIQKSAQGKADEAKLAEKLKEYHKRGVVVAAKELHISTRRANYIAEQYGITFACRGSHAARKEEQSLIPEIRALILQGLTQDQMCAQLHIGRTTLKRVAAQNGLHFRCKVDHAKDMVLVERIKAIRDVGCNRTACARKLEINPKVLMRLIREYEIDFPLSR